MRIVGELNSNILKKAASYFMELIIVVVGVSIAFQLNVWNDTRKNSELEDILLENFEAENFLNQIELDSTLLEMKQAQVVSQGLIKLLLAPEPAMDSIRIKMADLYRISWPDLTNTHLANFLEHESAISPLKEEMLLLNTLYSSANDLIKVYIEQKQEKYFDYLSEAVDMVDGLKVIKVDKLFDVRFRNNLVMIYSYEVSLIQTYEKILISQKRVKELIDEKRSE
jgi:hypothetical protein